MSGLSQAFSLVFTLAFLLPLDSLEALLAKKFIFQLESFKFIDKHSNLVALDLESFKLNV